MTDIQHARDVLAKWRRGVVVVTSIHDLVEGTAGNPDLLDAIDGLLAIANAAKGRNPFAAGYVVDAERIAAAIIAADEQMNA